MKKSSAIPPDESLLAQLWVRFKDGEGEAFDLLVEKRYRILYNYATRFTKDRELIQDCIQDLFLELWDRRAYLVETPCVTIYLLKALRNNLLRDLRNRNRLDDRTDVAETELDYSDGLNIEREWISGELTLENERNLRQAIERLPKRLQEVIFLKFYEGLDNEEIAQIMGVERQSAANSLHRALYQLKNQIPMLVRIILLPLFTSFS
ncbi:hypothetical protein BWI97_03440 [Siphonobacter sp. BAB-5405]|uniref:RNA polymerase sigma factor n=1 Tax=Siphonobacter sp. BAB-5405 TaxID=1864825 RepID=UPI000C7FBD2E|nr:sigma-70 family RNA polymerase sigma factor [Siphonobacter sp. BAB-5405]PMD98597.1 hypothetical protein BWI97_03440 [Siphonobacter sp. BAB-5405]